MRYQHQMRRVDPPSTVKICDTQLWSFTRRQGMKCDHDWGLRPEWKYCNFHYGELICVTRRTQKRICIIRVRIKLTIMIFSQSSNRTQSHPPGNSELVGILEHGQVCSGFLGWLILVLHDPKNRINCNSQVIYSNRILSHLMN